MSDNTLPLSEPVSTAVSTPGLGRSPTEDRAIRQAGPGHGPGALRTAFLMAGVTIREAGRRKILWIAAIAGVAFVAFFGIGLHAMLKGMRPGMATVNRNESLNIMIMMVLYAGTMLTSLMAALTSCDTVAGEIGSGTIHAIATKPVRRWSLVLGKWVGFVVMITLYVLLIEGGTIGVGWMVGGYLVPHAAAVLALIWLQALVLLGVTIAASTRLSALTSGAISLGLYGLAFVGGWIEQYGALQHVKTCVNLGILSSLIMPSDALWRRAAFKLQPPILGAMGISPFSSSLIPSIQIVIYAAVYAVLALLLAQILFERRDL